MASTFFYAVLLLPICITQWIGVITIGKRRRGLPWWLMLAGVSLSSLGGLFSIFATVAITSQYGGPSGLWMAFLPGVASGLGSLLFILGFMFHAFSFRRLVDRVAELEQVIEAQNEQLSR
jgi:hypothetical protein